MTDRRYTGGGTAAAQTDATAALASAAAAQTTANTASTTATTANSAATAASAAATAAQTTANGAVASAGFDLPTSTLAATLPRGLISSITLAALTSAQLFLVAIPLVAGQLISTITFLSGSTALNTGENQWFALYSAARAKLGVTNDDTSTAWAANATKTLTLASPYTVLTSGLYYLGIMVKATIAVPTLAGVLVPNTTALNLAPIICGNSTATLTNPASAPSTAGAITVAATLPYGSVA